MEDFQTDHYSPSTLSQTLSSIVLLNGECIKNSSSFLINATDNVLHITIPKNTQSTEPVYIIHLLDNPGLNTQNPLSIRVHSLENSHATIFEGYYLNNSRKPLNIHTLNEYTLSKQATLQHYLFAQALSTESLTQHMVIHQEQDSQYTNALLKTHPGQHHTDLTLHLNQSGASATVRALLLASETQIKTFKIMTHHHAPHCTTKTVVRGIANDIAQSHVTGTIMVHPKASQTNAHLDVKQLLLSEKAIAHIKPELEIYHHDIQCTHGATIGHLDEEALFYLKSRGLSDTDSKNLLISAFMQPILEHIPPNAITDTLKKAHGY